MRKPPEPVTVGKEFLIPDLFVIVSGFENAAGKSEVVLETRHHRLDPFLRFLYQLKISLRLILHLPRQAEPLNEEVVQNKRKGETDQEEIKDINFLLVPVTNYVKLVFFTTIFIDLCIQKRHLYKHSFLCSRQINK